MPKLKDDEILYRAQRILHDRMIREGDILTAPGLVRTFLETRLSKEKAEVFGMILLDNRNRVMATREMFRGTIDGASIYPRELARTVLDVNAAAVILFHNHPSGVTEPSQADIRITNTISELFKLLDVRVLDHIIVGAPGDATSFSERGLL